MTATTPVSLSPGRLLEFAESRADPDVRDALIDLAGKWKHGYIPLDAVAWAIKTHQRKGDGSRRRGIGRGSQDDLKPFTAARPGRGKSRADVRSVLAHHAAPTSAGRRKGAVRRAGPSAAPDVSARAAEAVRLRGPELRQRAQAGDKVAAAEIARRDAKRAEKFPNSRPRRSPGIRGVDDRAAGTPAEAKRAEALRTGQALGPASSLSPDELAAEAKTVTDPARKEELRLELHKRLGTNADSMAKIDAAKSATSAAFAASAKATDAESHRAAARAHIAAGHAALEAGNEGTTEQHTTRAQKHLEAAAAVPAVAAAAAKKKRAPSKLHAEFRAERDAQMQRFENHVRVGQNMSQDEYFGEGESAGRAPVEKRLTFADFRAERAARSADDRKHMQAYKAGRDHGMTGGQSDAEYNAAARGHDDESFGQGYTDGLIARDAVQAKAAEAGPQVIGTLSHHDELVTVHKTNGKHRVKIDGRQHGAGHATRAEAVAEAHTLVPEHRRASTEEEARAKAKKIAADTEAARKASVLARSGQPKPPAANPAAEINAATPERLAAKIGADSRDVQQHTIAAQKLADAGLKVGDTVTRSARQSAPGGHGPSTVTKQPGHWQVVGLSRNGNVRLRDTEHGSTIDAEPGLLEPVRRSELTDLAAKRAEKEARAADPGSARAFGEAARTGAPVNIGAEQARARQIERAKGPAVQDTMFGAHGERQDDMFTQASPAQRAVGIRSAYRAKLGGMTDDQLEAHRQALYASGLGDNARMMREVHREGDRRRIKSGQARTDAIGRRQDRAESRARAEQGPSGLGGRFGDYNAIAALNSGKRRDPSKPVKYTGKGGEALGEVHPEAGGTLEARDAAGNRISGGHKSLPAALDAINGEQSRRAAERIGMTFPAPTVRSHGLVGGGATVEASPSSSGRIRVEHTGDGTVVYGTERGDTQATEALKAQGFKWSRNLGGWYLPRTWSEPTRNQRVEALKGKLGDRLEVAKGDLARSGTPEEQAQARIERATSAAERNTARAERAATEADVRFGRAHAIGDMIPFGQPILVGHHSEARHRRDLAKIDTNMRAGMAAHAESEDATRRAANAQARASMETDPRAASRRLDRNRAELRKIERSLAATPDTSEHHARLTAMHRDLSAKIATDEQVAGAPKFGPHNVKPGDVVRVGGGIHVVTGGGKQNAKVLTSVGHLPYPWHQITAAGPMESYSTDALEKLIHSTGAPDRYKQEALAILAKRRQKG